MIMTTGMIVTQDSMERLLIHRISIRFLKARMLLEGYHAHQVALVRLLKRPVDAS
jgi:hypothetical protein